nr:unnamed protein product [Callosobruchus chinensis]
MLSTTKL